MRKQKEYEQLDLFAFSSDRYYISKPVRLIEFFAGVGFQRMGIEKALPNKVESWRTTEWAIPSIIAYDAVHNSVRSNTNYAKDFLVDELFRFGVSIDYDKPATRKQIERMPIEKLNNCYNAILRNRNLVNIMNVRGDDLGIVDTDKFEYILTYSFPCQDLSLAGDKKGMEVSQADGGTRSGLVWEVLRIITECKEKPQILLMENVPQIHSVENNGEFVKLQLELEKLGYRNFWQDLNGTDYGVPQNRVRTFMVSIHDPNAVYSFPNRQKLEKHLLDILEPSVDEKYFLTQKMVDYLTGINQKESKYDRGAVFERNLDPNKNYASTITCAAGQRPTDNFIVDDSLKSELCDMLIREGKVSNGDVVKHSYTNQILSGNKKCVEKNGEMITLTTRPDCVGVCVEDDPTRDGGVIMVKNNNSKGFLPAHEGDGVNICTRMEYQRGNVQKGKAQTLTCQGGNNVGVVVAERERERNLRIRKLTPLECCRLMGADDVVDQRLKEIGLGDAARYHIYGDGLIVSIPYNIIKQMIKED